MSHSYIAATVILFTWHNPIHIAAETEEARWEYPTNAKQPLLAPLTKYFISPLLI